MTEQFLLGLKILLVAWFFTNFDPIQNIVHKIEDRVHDKRIVNLIYPFQCFKCLTFWSVLILTFNIWTALALSLLASLIASVYGED